MEGEDQRTLEGTEKVEAAKREAAAKALAEAKIPVSESVIKDLQKKDELELQLKTAMERVSMLELGLEMKTQTTQRIVKENQDSIEIGAQATGRVKVYGDYGKKPEFAAKIKDALELLAATRATLEKDNDDGDSGKGNA